ncbi:MAG: imidazole glycerol-phosphate dehydratase/histidinol phosphatase, imidazoleglycerol-phosphate dehydratase / histidinol-phosphatase [Candidatus Peregrinibacteria bacterium GW2011_GWF2_38_29]|nr:MAG: imidazole glycerol-phosphate dehydratase/histidinol phosphatase, imidazoleglycerol-phosphate dehydratase / histidinol-phosphatase [Candidatus Peregrinibacteria bacterium GW2011_GWF2_38_29]HBB02345.1 bifunctional histidinol-phosphatase/imidazoleglycerol-phosphate dehydratase [Candidatus Peregrinibacteria bacterium]
MEPIKIAFLDRDGALIFEPPDTKQIDSIDKLKILPGVIDGLKKLRDSGYKLVMISNQDGVGTKSFPRKDFEGPQNEFLRLLKVEDLEFYKIFICPHKKEENCSCRKPKIGLLKTWLKSEKIDFEKSFMVGDRETDMQFAKNLGIRGIKMETNGRFPRIAVHTRKTNETDTFVLANLDGTGTYEIDTGLSFFNHIMEQLSKHSLIDLCVKANGDLNVDEHHTIEDIAITLGETLINALGEKRSIKRYGFLMPMDDSLVEVAIDLGGRPYFVFNCEFKREKVGDLPTEMIEHFFRTLSDSLKANIHINVKYSRNEHHKIEAMFKAFGKALRMACENDKRAKNTLPTTKGII